MSPARSPDVRPQETMRLAVSGFWWCAVCLAVPTVFGVIRWSRRRT
jgi:hypothetical protein